MTVTTATTVADHAPPRPATTAELLHAATDGDQVAWRELVLRFEPIGGTILDLGLQPADARDAAQRTWLQMVENHSKIRKPEALGGWLRTTARHECLRIIRERWRVDPRRPRRQRVPDATVDVEQAVVDADTAPAARPGHHAAAALRPAPDRAVPRRAARLRRARPPHGHPDREHRPDPGTCAAGAQAVRRGPAAVTGRRAGRDRWSTALACTRLCTPILWKIRVRCTPTVFSLM